MDEIITKDTEYYLAHYWSILAVGLVVYFGGLSVKRLLRIWVPDATPEDKQPFWYRLWHATQDWHPVGVGGLLGLVPWPVPGFITSWYVRVLWFAAVGAVSGQLYRAIKKTIELIPELIRKRFGGGGGGSSPSDPGAVPGGE